MTDPKIFGRDGELICIFSKSIYFFGGQLFRNLYFHSFNQNRRQLPFLLEYQLFGSSIFEIKLFFVVKIIKLEYRNMTWKGCGEIHPLIPPASDRMSVYLNLIQCLRNIFSVFIFTMLLIYCCNYIGWFPLGVDCRRSVKMLRA